MSSATLRLIIASLVMVTAIVASSTVRKGPGASRPMDLSLRQRVDLIYVNGVRNALRADDDFRQGRMLREALEDIRTLRGSHAAAFPEEEKRMDHRVRQLQKMIAKENPIESL